MWLIITKPLQVEPRPIARTAAVGMSIPFTLRAIAQCPNKFLYAIVATIVCLACISLAIKRSLVAVYTNPSAHNANILGNTVLACRVIASWESTINRPRTDLAAAYKALAWVLLGAFLADRVVLAAI